MPLAPLILDNPVDQVVRSIRTPIDKATINQAKESLRILQARASSHLAPKDRPEYRAAVVLEHVARLRGIKIPIEELIAAVALRRKNFVQLQAAVSHHLLSTLTLPNTNANASKNTTNTSTNTQSRPSSTVPSITTPHEREVHDRPTKRPRPTAPCDIPNLSIRLAGYTVGPLECAHQALQLWENLKQHIESLPKARRIPQQQDLKRYREAYEAAVYFAIATERPKTPLQLDDVHQCLQHNIPKKQFHQIFRHVQSLKKELERKKIQHKDYDNSTTEQNHPTDQDAAHPNEHATDNNFGTYHAKYQDTSDNHALTPSFETWRQSVVDQALHATREKYPDLTENILQQAADDIFAKYGLSNETPQVEVTEIEAA